MLAAYVLVTLTAYLLGGIPFGYLFVRFALGKDIRKMGSGNIGATNVQRSAGSKAGIIVLLLDIAKAALAVWFADVYTHGDAVAVGLAAFAVMAGHAFPVFLRFRGGKAVACFVGAFLYIAPISLLLTAVLFVIIVALTSYISLGSILGGIVFPVVLWTVAKPGNAILLSAVAGAILVVARHHANIRRLIAGTENRFSLKGRRT